MEPGCANFSQTSAVICVADPPEARPYSRELSLGLMVLAPMWPVIISFGFISNITNIIIFLKVGLKENVSTLLLSLSVSDLIYLTLITPTMCGMFFLAYAKDYPWPFDERILRFLFYWPAITVYDISAFISVSLGVVRCACVAMPLKFKLVFTKSRTVKWVLFLVVLAVGLRIPVLLVFRIAYRTDPATNVWTVYLEEISNQDDMFHINDILNRGVIIYFNFITMVACICILSFKLQQASLIRQSCTIQPSQSSGPVAKKLSTQKQPQAKDLQVIKSVVLVCIIFIFSHLPFLIVSTYRLFDPNFTDGRRLHNLMALFLQVSLTFSYLNASVNIFVYYNYNSKYRAVLLSLLNIQAN